MTKTSRIRGIFLASFIFSGALFCQCPDKVTTIFFGNGMFVSREDAREQELGEISPNGLETRLRSRLEEIHSPVKFECLKFALAYNSKEKVKLDLLEAMAQLVGEDMSILWRWLSSLQIIPDALQDFASEQAKLNDEFSYIVDNDLREHVLHYVKEKRAGNKSIVVAHSQGNFYANAAYSYIYGTPSAENDNTFSIVSVGSPSSYVSGSNSPYTHTTIIEDGVINSFPVNIRAMPANVSNVPYFDCGKPVECHSFVNSYLAGPVSGPKILDQIIAEITGYPQPQILQLTDTKLPSQNFSPTISRDGSRVAFVSDANLQGLNQSMARALFVIKSNGTGLTRIGEELIFDFVGQPPELDAYGKKVAFIAKRSFSDLPGIFISNTDGTNLRQIPTFGIVAGVAMSSDGSTIVYTSFPEYYGSKRIYTVNPDGANQKMLIEFCCNNSGDGSFVPGISGDGNKITFLFSRALSIPKTSDSISRRLAIINKDGTNFREIKPNNYEIYSQAISDDGSTVVTTSGSDSGSVFIYNGDGEYLNVFKTNNFIGSQAIDLSFDGSLFMYHSLENIFIINFKTQVIQQVSVNLRTLLPSMNGWGDKIVFQSISNPSNRNEDSNQEIFVLSNN
ncbi:MAG TPA: hypothetical protein VJH71_03315 [Candidatus Paceibacterota bacterium]